MGWLPGGPGPGHELVEARSRPEIDQAGEHVGEVGLRVDAVQFAGFDERGDAGPVLGALIVTGEERIFAIEDNGTDSSLDGIGIELDATVVEEAGEPVPMMQGVADGIGDDGLARDPRELELEPRPQPDDKWSAAFLAHDAARIGGTAVDRLLDRIECGAAFERLAGDRRVAVFGDIEELTPQMRPAEGERDRLLAGSAGNRLIGGISVALHDAAIGPEELKRMDRSATGSVAVGDRRRVGSAPGSVVAGDGPEVPLLNAAAAGIEHRRHRLVDRDPARGQN